MAGRPIERNPNRTIQVITEMWMDGKPDSEILKKMGWVHKSSMNKYFKRNGYSVKKIRDMVNEKRKEIGL